MFCCDVLWAVVHTTLKGLLAAGKVCSGSEASRKGLPARQAANSAVAPHSRAVTWPRASC